LAPRAVKSAEQLKSNLESYFPEESAITGKNVIGVYFTQGALPKLYFLFFLSKQFANSAFRLPPSP
jgi:hypothetical protein